MTYREKQSKFLLDMSKLIIWANENGYEVTSGEFERTSLMAEHYKKIGKSNAGLNSLHCKRMAADLNIYKDGKYLVSVEELKPIALYWESLDPLNSWGGTGTKLMDYPHFSRGEERPEWRRLS